MPVLADGDLFQKTGTHQPFGEGGGFQPAHGVFIDHGIALLYDLRNAYWLWLWFQREQLFRRQRKRQAFGTLFLDTLYFAVVLDHLFQDAGDILQAPGNAYLPDGVSFRDDCAVQGIDALYQAVQISLGTLLYFDFGHAFSPWKCTFFSCPWCRVTLSPSKMSRAYSRASE